MKKDKTLIFLMILAGVAVGSCTAFFTSFSFTMSIIFLGILLIIACAYLAAPKDVNFLITLALAGFLLRILVSLLLYVYTLPFGYFDSKPGFEGFFVMDGWGYYNNGLLLNNFWKAGMFPGEEVFRRYYSFSRTTGTYDYINGSIIWLGGKSPVALFFFNSLVGTLTVIVVYLCTIKVSADKKAARYAAFLYCFWPSIILWSSQNLKEPICCFLIGVIILGILALLRKFSPWYALCIIFSALVLSKIRPLLCLMMALVLLVAYIYFISKRKYKAPFYLITFMILLTLWFLSAHTVIGTLKDKLFGLLIGESHFHFTLFLKRLSYLREVRAFGGSAVFQGFEFTTIPKLIFFIPLGVGIVFLMPFPWQIGSFMQLFAIPEMMVWYALIPATVLGFLYSFKRQRFQTILILFCIMSVAIMIGLAEGNVGTIFRHKSAVFGLCLIFTGIGIGAREFKKTDD